MSETNKINISSLEQYKNEFSSEKSNFKRLVYNSFSSCYLRRCSDQYVRQMCQKLESCYQNLDEAYNNIDSWWNSYIENVKGVENTLSEKGKGIITESVVRSAISNLPNLLTLKATNLSTALMNTGVNVKNSKSNSSSGNINHDFSNIFSGYNSPTEQFLFRGGKSYDEVQSFVNQQQDEAFSENILTKQEYKVYDEFDDEIYDALFKPYQCKPIIVDNEQYIVNHVYTVCGASDASYYQIMFYNTGDENKNFYGVDSTEIGLSVMCYDSNGNQTKFLAIPVDENGNIQYDKLITVLEKKGDKLYQYYTESGMEGLVQNIYKAETIDIMRVYSSIHRISESYYENGSIKERKGDISVSYYENGSIKERKDSAGHILESYYENGQVKFQINNDGSIEEYYADGAIEKIKNVDGTSVSPNLNKGVYHDDGTKTVYRVNGYELYDSNGNHVIDYYSDGTVRTEYPSDGSIISYDENGRIDNILYSDKSRNYYYPNGNIKIRQDNIIDGSYIYYRTNGTIEYTCSSDDIYVYYKEDGITVDYTKMPDGKITYPNN